MTNCPQELFYTQSHEWVRQEANNEILIGVTEHAQKLLGELVYVELPVVHRQVSEGEEVAVLESVKTAADVYSPVSGEIIAINESLQENPNQINQDPYGKGWLFKLKIIDHNVLSHLMSASSYHDMISSAIPANSKMAEK
jgi:glycine cleavage system H protein